MHFLCKQNCKLNWERPGYQRTRSLIGPQLVVERPSGMRLRNLHDNISVTSSLTAQNERERERERERENKSREQKRNKCETGKGAGANYFLMLLIIACCW